MFDLRDLYQEVIIDHNRNPRNFRVIDHPTHHAEGHNPLCGDRLTLYLQVDDNDIIQDASFQGTGCAISVASASMMTDYLRGKSVQDAEQLFEKFHAVITDDLAPEDADLGKLAALAGVKDFPARVKCATLCWHTMHAALSGDGTPAKTE
jgi:nitrogen fixation NifU-like protein